VQTQKKKPYHLGRPFLERPVLSIYALRSPNAEGVMTDWQLPPELLGDGVTVPPFLNDVAQTSSGESAFAGANASAEADTVKMRRA
jgi:hypothetical protein